jgi:hypothetical protein
MLWNNDYWILQIIMPEMSLFSNQTELLRKLKVTLWNLKLPRRFPEPMGTVSRCRWTQRLTKFPPMFSERESGFKTCEFLTGLEKYSWSAVNGQCVSRSKVFMRAACKESVTSLVTRNSCCGTMTTESSKLLCQKCPCFRIRLNY